MFLFMVMVMYYSNDLKGVRLLTRMHTVMKSASTMTIFLKNHQIKLIIVFLS